MDPAALQDEQGKEEKVVNDDCRSPVPVTTPYRWIIVTLYSLVYFGNCSAGVIYAIADLSCKYYGVTIYQITWSGNACYLTQLPGCLIGTAVASWLGLRATLIVSSGLNAVSACVMFAGAQPEGFLLFVTGYVIQTLSNCLVVSLAPEISAVWFEKDSQVQATSFGLNFGYYVGNSVGFLIPAIVFQNAERNQDMQFVRNSLFWILTSQVIFTGLLFVLVIVFFRERPKIAPSIAETKRSELTSEASDRFSVKGFLKDMWLMITNRNVQFAAFSLAFIEYTDLVIQGQLNQIFSWKYPGAEDIIGWFGFGVYWVSLAGATLLGFVVDRTKEWKMCSLILSFVSTVSWVGFALCLRQFTYLPLTFTTYFVHAFVSTPLTPIIADLVVEITYPVSPSHSYVYLLTITQLYAVVMVFVSGWLFQMQLYEIYLWTLSGAFVMATFLICLLKVDTKRSAIEANAETSSRCGDSS